MKKIIFCLLSGILFLWLFTKHKLPKVQVPVFKKDSFNIIKYGAKADGITLNTKSIQ